MDGRIVKMTTPLVSCLTCEYYSGKLLCRVFEKIPQEILTGKNDHKKPVAGDGGIVYKEKVKNDPNITDGS